MAEARPSSSTPDARVPWYARSRTTRSLQVRDWRVLWMAGHLWHVAFWADLFILSWLVLELTDSPLKVSLVGAFRLLPLGILGFIAGSQADRVSKKGLLLVAQGINLSVTSGFVLVLALGLVQDWHIFLAAVLTGTAWAIDLPVRRAFIRDILPEQFMANAIAIDVASLTGTAMVARWLAGGLLALVGVTVTYGLLIPIYVIGLLLLLSVPGRPVHTDVAGDPGGVLQGIWEGMVYAWRNKVLRGVVIVTVFVNVLVFPYIQLTPVFAKDVFGVGPALLGLMGGMDGFGALVGTLVLASLAVTRRRGAIFITGSLFMGIGALLFGLSGSFAIAIPWLVVVGLGMSGFATMQMTIAVTIPEPAMRGRAMGAVAFGIGLLPLGMLYMGLLAEWIGAPSALAYSALSYVVILLVVTLTQPVLRRFS